MSKTYIHLSSLHTDAVNKADFTIRLPRRYTFPTDAVVTLNSFSISTNEFNQSHHKIRLVVPFEYPREVHLDVPDSYKDEYDLVKKINISIKNAVKREKAGIKNVQNVVPSTEGTYTRFFNVFEWYRYGGYKNGPLSFPRIEHHEKKVLQVCGNDEKGAPYFVILPLKLQNRLNYIGMVLHPNMMELIKRKGGLKRGNIVMWSHNMYGDSIRCVPTLTAGELVPIKTVNFPDETQNYFHLKYHPPIHVQPRNQEFGSREVAIVCNLVDSSCFNTSQILNTFYIPFPNDEEVTTTQRYSESKIVPLWHNLSIHSFDEISIKIKDEKGTIMMKNGIVLVTICISVPI